MRFEEAYAGWQAGRLRREEAARLLGVCERSFRRYIDRYEEAGLEGLIDRRMVQVSGRCAPVDEVLEVVGLYRGRYAGWNVRHFHSWYLRAHGGTRSYSWVKNTLQAAGAVQRASGRSKHRKRRERAPMRGMMLHQDGSTHEWVPSVQWDLIVTLDDCHQRTHLDVLRRRRGERLELSRHRSNHCRQGTVCGCSTPIGRVITSIPPRPGARWINKRLPKWAGAGAVGHPASAGLFTRGTRALGAGVSHASGTLAQGTGGGDIEAANRYLEYVYRPAYNAKFAVPAAEAGSAYVHYIGPALADILCEQFERTVGRDNCVSFEGFTLRIPADRHRHH